MSEVRLDALARAQAKMRHGERAKVNLGVAEIATVQADSLAYPVS